MHRAGTKGNQEALIFEIANSGFDRKSVCRSEHKYTTKVVNGEIENDAWFGFIALLDEDDDPFEDEDCRIKANPNLGVSIQKPFIREQVVEAKGMGSKENLVRRLHFCEWTDSDAAAISRQVWEAALGDVEADALSEQGYPCFGGLDLSRANDVAAFTLTWLLHLEADKWRFASKTWFWTPKDTLKDRVKRDRAPYEVWAKDGRLDRFLARELVMAGSRMLSWRSAPNTRR
jgi:phage terminase large subunit-like protein